MSTPDPPDVKLASSLRIAVVRLARRLRVQRMDASLTLTQISALVTLYGRGPMSPTAVAEVELVQPPSMTRVLAALEELGLVERNPHESDRRQSVIAITAAGKKRVEEDRMKSELWLANAIKGLGPEDLEILAAATVLLERLSGAEPPR